MSLRKRLLWPWYFAKRHRYKLLSFKLLLLLAYYFCLPAQLFKDPESTVLFDRQGRLLGAKIAADGQWRFPMLDSLPPAFVKALICFEDKRFYSHWGIDPWALGRAINSNLQQGQIVSGGSTLTMQLMRLSYQNPPRNLWQKCKEAVLASRVEWSYSKDEILRMYASHAPFGGNVVGLSAAAWRYFGREPQQLSWAECAMLAVLPNSPALIHPGRNRKTLLDKRNRLLGKLLEQGHIDSSTWQLACLEPIPEEPKPLPQLAPHLLERAHRERLKNKQSGLIISTLQIDLQKRLLEIAERHHQQLRQNEIHNLAVVVCEVSTGDILAYLGNAPETSQEGSVDMVMAERSSGSIFKPFLYAAILQNGQCYPEQLMPDVPVQFRGYAPKNYSLSYEGSVPASRMVAASLNVPAVFMLQQYGVQAFHQKLKDLGIETLHQPASHYGLSLIVGGAETKLWDLMRAYGGMARSLLHFGQYSSRYERNAYRNPNYLLAQSQGRLHVDKHGELQPSAPLNAGAIWHAFNAMQEVVRPDEEAAWNAFSSSSRVAWKTGTSFGFRDAWAVGITPRYVVGVWVGNADGEGRPELIGVRAAAPILFEVFHALGNPRTWFDAPYDELRLSEVCRTSGHPPSPHCPEVDSLWIYRAEQSPLPCPYHHLVNLSADGQFQVAGHCESPAKMRQEVFFTLPSAQEHFYTAKHPKYRRLPPYRSDCRDKIENNGDIQLLYPSVEGLRILLPKNLDGSRGKVVLRATCRNPQSKLYWHLDDEYLGETQTFHDWGLEASPGPHRLSLVDEEGRHLIRNFTIEY